MILDETARRMGESKAVVVRYLDCSKSLGSASHFLRAANYQVSLGLDQPGNGLVP